MFVPTKAFLTKGVGRHKEKLTSFEMSLRDAHLANFNLVRVSSIFPPHCELMDREEGLSLKKPGQVVFAVIAESSRSEEHTSELQSRPHLVCRLLLEKKKTDNRAQPVISLTLLVSSLS